MKKCVIIDIIGMRQTAIVNSNVNEVHNMYFCEYFADVGKNKVYHYVNKYLLYYNNIFY